MPKNAELIRTLENTASAISTHPPTKWAGFTLYIIETLDCKLDEHDGKDYLQAILDTIQTRREEHVW